MCCQDTSVPECPDSIKRGGLYVHVIAKTLLGGQNHKNKYFSLNELKTYQHKTLQRSLPIVLIRILNY